MEIRISVAGAGDDPAGSPGVSGEPKDPQERKPAGISSEVAAKTRCQPSAQAARSGCGVCPGKDWAAAIVPCASIPAPSPFAPRPRLRIEMPDGSVFA